MHSLWQDLRYGARMLMKRRGTTIVAVVTLALGIGANTSIFSAVNAVLLRPLPYDHPEQLVAIYTALPSLGYQRAGLSEAEFVRLRRAERSFIDIAGWNWDRATLRGLSEPERVAAPLCTANLFRLLGVRMALGRDFSAEEETAGKNKVAVLAYSFWRRKFSGDPAIIGRRLEIDGEDVTVIGVLPTMFKAPFELQADTSASADLWRPVALNPSNPRRRGEGWSMTGIGRLRPGVTIAAALAEHNANVRREAIGYPQGYPPDSSGVLLPLERAVAGDLRLALLILVGAVAVVLLIACVNVANLLLVSGEDRRREIALRAALGASRGRIVRQLLIESTLLSVQGGILGLLLAIWGVDALLAISPKNIPRLAETSLDHRVLYFTLLVSLAAAVIFGLAPALRAVRFDLHTTLKESGRGAGPSSRLRQSLVVLETTLAVILLVAAGLLFRSFWKLQRVELGFQPDHLLTMRLTPGPGYSDNKRIAILYEGLISRVSALPGVESAAVIHPLPINNTGADTPIEIEFDKLPRREKRADFRTVSSAYFQAMGMRMVQGRSFTLGDREGATPVAVINETFARSHWPGEVAVGKRFRNLNPASPGRAATRFLTVVGVVADAKNRELAGAVWPEAYIPLAQHEADAYSGGDELQQAFNLVVRTTADPSSLAAAVQRESRAVERGFIISQVRPLDEILADIMVRPRFNMILLGCFAVLALGLAAVGLYGVISYTVSQRTREIGIRMALGAQAREMVMMLLRQGMSLALLGVASGLAVSLALTRLLKTMVYGVSVTDPVTFMVIALVLPFVALLACWIPARRAARVNPLIALRVE